MIRRTFDPSFLNEVINHPEVRPWLKGEGPLDISTQALDPANFILESEFGGFVLMRHAPGRYEVHSQFLPGHGTHPIKAMHSAQEWMFTRTDCDAIFSKVPKENKAAKGFARAGGLRPLFESADIELVELTQMDWAMRTIGLEAHGERFHDFIEAARHAKGLEWPDHPYDPAHERAVGAALLMFERGQPQKAATFYNRWALMAGYPAVQLLSDAPVVLDMSVEGLAVVLGLSEDRMEMLLCR